MFRLSLADMCFGRFCNVKGSVMDPFVVVSEDFTSAILEYACATGANSHVYAQCTSKMYIDPRVCPRVCSAMHGHDDGRSSIAWWTAASLRRNIFLCETNSDDFKLFVNS